MVEGFFGCRLFDCREADSDVPAGSTLSTGERYWINYQGQLLQYELIIDVPNETVMISGDPEQPWGGQSMYEIGAPCTSIDIEECGSGQPAMFTCFYKDQTGQSKRTLTILKRPDTDLVVWPSVPFPPGHPYSD